MLTLFLQFVVLRHVVLAMADHRLLGQFNLQSGPLWSFSHFYFNVCLTARMRYIFPILAVQSSESCWFYSSVTSWFLYDGTQARLLVFSPPTIYLNTHAQEKKAFLTKSSASGHILQQIAQERVISKFSSWSRRLLPNLLLELVHHVQTASSS